MNKLFIFVLGAATGSVVTWQLVKEKYRRLADEEIESVKVSFRKLQEDAQKRAEAAKNKPDLSVYMDALAKSEGAEQEPSVKTINYSGFTEEPEVEEEINRLMGRFEEQMKMQGISLDLYYQFTQSNEEALRSQMEKEAYKNVLYRLMLEEIAKQEKIEISDKEAKEEAKKMAEKYEMDKDEFLKMFGGLEMIKYDMQMHKAMDIIKGDEK